MRKFELVGLAALLALAMGCGGSGGGGGFGGGGGASGANVQPISVNLGPLNDYVNGVFTSVTICAPGTNNCQTINDVLVDTGSFGLRVLAAANDPQGGLTLSLPAETDASGRPFGKCTQFADNSFLWGPVKMADVKMGGTNNSGKVASNIPINVVGDAAFSAVPTSCSNGGTDVNSLNKLGAHGILGVGVFIQDCGPACVSGSTPPTPLYYVCPSSGCVPSFASLQQQVSNPVAAFASDNNGVIIELPSVPATGAANVAGSMVFGIGTQSNNALPPGAHVFSVNGFASFRTTYKGVNYGPHTGTGTSDSYIDSGSNGLFFPDSSIPNCPSPEQFFFCPTSTLSLTATQVSSDLSTSNSVTFSIANANSLFSANNGANGAFSNLGGTNSNVFDWGLPFFFGRNVFNGFETQPNGPFWAY